MVDPITLELIAEALISIVREMRTIVIRTAYSSMIHEGHDFSCAILTPDGHLLAASEVDQPTHLSALPWSARSVLAKYATDIAAGDLFLHNDPYTGGTHLNDVVVLHPMLMEGRLIALLAVMAHWQDIGGMVPGSLSGNATEIYQEGVRIPAIRVARGGKLVAEIAELLFANVRAPDDRQGDLNAMSGACRIAEGKVGRLIARWSVATFQQAAAALLDRAEVRMRAAIARLPEGSYPYETYLDHAGGGDPTPLALRVTLGIANGEIHADFTGCPPQVQGPTNLGPAHAWTATYTMTKAFLDPQSPVNAGALRPIRVTAPLGTIVNARPPAACGAIGEVRRALEGLVMGALGMADPERLVGDLKGASNITTVSGFDLRRRRAFTFVEFPAGGTGATARVDGNNTVRNFAEGDLSSIHPVEAIEHAYPLRVERMILRRDSGGDGRRRGGLGLQREVRLLAPDARLSVLSDKNVIPPYGVRGGYGGAPNRFTVIRGGEIIEPSPMPGKVTGFRMRQDDILVMRTAGGGGYGDPLEREAERVARDVRLGYVSPDRAMAVYGVVLDGDDVDLEATVATRGRLAARRLRLIAMELAGPEHEGGRRIIALSAAATRHFALVEGGLIEIPSADGPSVRAWARVDATLAADACALGASSFAMLRLRPGASLEVRRIVAVEA
jgi:N-methylhydantoinase B